ncbi:MAG: HEPN domain-containing protein [Cyanobacteriota bacterium]|nr:HEPN domain-containing protein [Cyanobacteriota bacterium]
MEPTTAADWMAVADERLADAEAILKERPDSVASVYMAGYAIECALKALLQKRGIASPSYGREGHDLRGLWSAANLNFSANQDPQGTQTFFFEEWNTALRYEKFLPSKSGLKQQELLKGARRLKGWIYLQINRSKPRRL